MSCPGSHLKWVGKAEKAFGEVSRLAKFSQGTIF